MEESIPEKYESTLEQTWKMTKLNFFSTDYFVLAVHVQLDI